MKNNNKQDPNNNSESVYRFRMVPVMERLMKKQEINLEDKDKESLIKFCLNDLEQMSLKDVIGMSDRNLNKHLKYLLTQETALKILSKSGAALKKANNFDIRHKEVLRLFLKEYFELFFPDLAKRMNFETAEFKDKAGIIP